MFHVLPSLAEVLKLKDTSMLSLEIMVMQLNFSSSNSSFNTSYLSNC